MNWIIRHHRLFALIGMFGLFSLAYFPTSDTWWFGFIAFLALLGFVAGRLPQPSHS